MARADLLKVAAGIALFAGTFVGISYLAHTYQAVLTNFIGAGGVMGVVVLAIIEALFTIFFIPLDSSVLVPLAVHVWGALVTAGTSVVGWTAGSAVAFWIARNYGRPVVERIVGTRRIERAQEQAPRTHLFWWVVATQALVQVDFISYMFGLFTPIDFPSYVIATAIGDILPAFFFSYAGILPPWYAGAAVAVGIAITTILFWRFTLRSR